MIIEDNEVLRKFIALGLGAKRSESVMLYKTMTFIEQHHMLSEQDLVAAGVSGGADSLCLLLVLLEYQKKVPFELIVVHVNHLIREDAGADADFVREICRKEGIPFYLKEAEVDQLAKKQHISQEEAGRKVRYEAFEEALDLHQKQRIQKKQKKIAVAHHQGDSAETLLFHLFRGTGIYGMTGILPVNGSVIRPLLNCSRKEIEDYLVKRGQPWCIDSTNEEDTYTRNKIRHHILGYADEEINPKSTQHVAKAALQMAALREYLDSQVLHMMEQITQKQGDAVGVCIEKLKSYPQLLRGQFLLTLIGEMIPGRKDIGFEHIQGILDLLDKTGTKKMNLPQNLEVVKEYGILWIQRSQPKDLEDNKGKKDHGTVSSDMECELRLDIGESYYLADGSVLELSIIKPEDLEQIEEKKYTKYFDYDKMNSCLKLRFRQKGDYLTFNQQGQKKSLKAYFIDEKIPALKRDDIPVIADENHILWIIGYRISAYYKVTSETKKIVQISIRRDKNVRES